MAVVVLGKAGKDKTFFVTEGHWHAIVEHIRRLELVPEPRIVALHDRFDGGELTKAECAKVAAGLREKTIAGKADEEVLVVPVEFEHPDVYLLREYAPDNYGTTVGVLRDFAEFLDDCGGLSV